jgi:hypothetical protein
MTIDNFQKNESIAAADRGFALNLASLKIDDIRQLNKGLADPKDGLVHPLHIEDPDRKSEHFVRAEKPEDEQQRQDQLIKRAFGNDVFEHIKDQAWLLDHTDALKKGFNSVFDNNHEFTAGQIAGRLKELSGGLIYSEHSQGSKNPFSGDASRPDDHFQVFLKRNYWFDAEVFHQVTERYGQTERERRRK